MHTAAVHLTLQVHAEGALYIVTIILFYFNFFQLLLRSIFMNILTNPTL